MNSKEYLLAFYDALGDLPHDVKADAMSEYQNYFKIGIEQGRTEEEISASLGDPFTLAYAVKQRSGYFNSPSNSSKSYKRFRFGRFIIGIIVVLLATSAFSIHIAKKEALLDLAFVIGTRYDVDESNEIDLSNAKRIEIDVISSDTTLYSSDSKKGKATLTGHVRTTGAKALPVLEVRQSGGVLFISEKKKSGSSSFYSSNLKMDISIPNDFAGEVVFKGVSANFTASDQTFENMKLQLTSGDFSLKNILLKDDFEAASTSGNIKIEGLSTSQHVKIASSSGDITIKDLNCRQFTMANISGNIKTIQNKVDLFSARTVSGNIILEDLDGSAQLKTTSGDIKVNCQSPKEKFDLSTISGNANISFPVGSGFNLDAQTTSGRINCDFDLDPIESGKRTLKGKCGAGEIPVILKTTSGNIHISENK